MSELDVSRSIRRVYFQLMARDLERAKRYYEEIFSLDVTFYESPEVGWCEFQLPGGAPRLGLNSSRGGEGPDWGRLALEVDDIEAMKRYLEGKSIETSEITDVPGLVSYFNMKDSEGNTVQIVADPRVGS